MGVDGFLLLLLLTHTPVVSAHTYHLHGQFFLTVDVVCLFVCVRSNGQRESHCAELESVEGAKSNFLFLCFVFTLVCR